MDVLLRLGPECNQRCLFCNVPTCPRMSTQQVIEWIDNLQDKISILSITGGEPTLRKDLLFIIKKISQNNLVGSINLQTNATLMSYRKYVKNLKKAGLNSFFVAFHSHKESVSNRLTNSNLWDKTVKGIENLLEEKTQVILNPVINKLNYSLLPQYVRFVKEHFPSISNISLSFVQPYGSAWDNKWIIPKFSEVLPYLKRTLKFCAENNINFANPYCGFPLCFFPDFEEKSNEYGDASLNSRLEKEAFERVKNLKIKSPSCKQCIYTDKCGGFWINYAKIYGLSEFKPVLQ